MKIDLPHHFELRGYQEPLHTYMVSPTEAGRRLNDRRAGKRAAIVWHRRTGKDKTCFAQEIVPAMFERVGVYHYYFPTMADGRKILWNGIDKAGFPLINHFPSDLIDSKRDTDMVIKAKNGSLFQIIGSDRVESVGTNPVGSVFSEFSKQNPRWWDLVRPILAENEGWAIFNWTPRGKNHAYRMDRMARNNPKWFYQLLTADMTNAISQEAIDEDRLSGMSEEMVQQEYYCSYSLGVEGAYYGRILGKLWDDGRIGNVAIDPNALTHTAWDLGYGDSTAIWFFQLVGNEIHLVDYYENHGEAIRHYVDILNDKGYLYGTHYGPHDVKKGSLATGETLLETAAGLGLIFETLQREHDVDDGIERARGIFHRCWFDQERCKQGIDCLENYHSDYNEKNAVYSTRPTHDWASHGADAFRYLSKAVELCGTGVSKTSWQALKEQYA